MDARWLVMVMYRNRIQRFEHDTISNAGSPWLALSVYFYAKLLTLLILFAFSQFSSARPIHDLSRMNAIMWPVWVHKAKTNEQNSKRATISLLLWLRWSMRVLFAAAAVWIVSILWPLHACTAFGAPNPAAWAQETLSCICSEPTAPSQCGGVLPLVLPMRRTCSHSIKSNDRFHKSRSECTKGKRTCVRMARRLCLVGDRFRQRIKHYYIFSD